MRIGIDGRPLQTVSRYRGLGAYTYNVLKNLLAVDSENHYVVFGFVGKEFPPLGGGNVEFAPVLRRLGIDSRWLWETFFLNGIVSRYGLDIFHVTQPCCITGSAPYRIVATVHDVIPLVVGGRYEESTRPDRRMSYRRQLRTISRADGIITYSRATTDDLVEILNIPRDRIYISPIGYDESFSRIGDPELIERITSKYGIQGGYILFVGGMERRKNLRRLLRVLPAVQGRCGYVRFVIISWMPESHHRRVQSIARELHLENVVHVLGHIPLTDLVAIMNGALMVALPSSYEGFGLPVLEAMACGTPVLTSNVSSLPEVAGDAALLVDPSSDEEIRDGIVDILSNEGLRNKLRAKGLERAKLFSWKRHAEDILKVYRGVVEEEKCLGTYQEGIRKE